MPGLATNCSPPVVTDDPHKSHRWPTEVASAAFAWIWVLWVNMSFSYLFAWHTRHQRPSCRNSCHSQQENPPGAKCSDSLPCFRSRLADLYPRVWKTKISTKNSEHSQINLETSAHKSVFGSIYVSSAISIEFWVFHKLQCYYKSRTPKVVAPLKVLKSSKNQVY